MKNLTVANLRKAKLLITKSGQEASTPVNTIDSFSGQYDFLSNFHASPILYNQLVYPTVEHAYQAHKSNSMDDRVRIAALLTPAQAKAEGRKIKITRREDWEHAKFHIMRKLLFLKFFGSSILGCKLLSTGKAYLVEGNTWGDTYWGVCKGKGENNLGILLMEVREILGA